MIRGILFSLIVLITSVAYGASGIDSYETHYPTSGEINNLIFIFHGFLQVQSSGVLKNIREASKFDLIGDATDSIIVYPRATFSNWKTTGDSYEPQLKWVFEKRNEILKEQGDLDVYYGGFSDGCMFSYICGIKDVDVAGVILYSGFVVNSVKDIPTSHKYKVLLLRNNKEIVANERQRQKFVSYYKSRDIIPVLDTGKGRHIWDVNLNGTIEQFINGNRVSN